MPPVTNPVPHAEWTPRAALRQVVRTPTLRHPLRDFGLFGPGSAAWQVWDCPTVLLATFRAAIVQMLPTAPNLRQLADKVAEDWIIAGAEGFCVTTPAARLTRHDYYDAAMRVLAATSADALTINALCEELHVSKGSFYHHFAGWPGFVAYLLETWEQEYALEVKRMVDLLESPGRRVRLLTKIVGMTPHDAEAALRVWSLSDPAVKAAVERVDKVRVDITTDVLKRSIPRAQAVQIAELYLAVTVHMQLASRPVDVRKMTTLLRSLMDLTVAQYGQQVFGD